MSESEKSSKESIVPSKPETSPAGTPRSSDGPLGAGMGLANGEDEMKKDAESVDFSTPDSAENMALAEDGSIKGGTIEKLLQKMTSADSNVSLLFDFLITYRSYTTPQYLLALLRRRFEQVVESEDTRIVRLRVINFMKQWIEKHTYDWIDDSELIAGFSFTIELWERIDPSYQKSVAQLSGIQQKTIAEYGALKEKKMKTFTTPPPAPEFPSELDPAKLKFIDISSAELARQFTLAAWRIWEEIKPTEFLNLNWAKAKKDTLAPNIVALTRHFNRTANWITTMILQAESLKERVKLVTKIVQVAESLKNLNNFISLMAILSGLESASVHRLRQTWEALPKSVAETLEDVKNLMTSRLGFKSYRDNLRTVNPPTIPYLGISLTDLTFIYEGSKDMTSSGLINFAKCRMVAQTIKTLMQYQHTSYNFVNIPVIRDFMMYPTTWDDTTLYQYSLYREPREGSKPITEAPPIVISSDPPPWLASPPVISLPKTKIVKEPPKEWKSSTLVIRRGVLRAADLRNAILHLLYISESDPSFNTYSNTFFSAIKSLGGLPKIFEVFEQLLAEAPLEDDESLLQSPPNTPSEETKALAAKIALSSSAGTVPRPSNETSTRSGSGAGSSSNPVSPRPPSSETAAGPNKVLKKYKRQGSSDTVSSEDSTASDATSSTADTTGGSSEGTASTQSISSPTSTNESISRGSKSPKNHRRGASKSDIVITTIDLEDRKSTDLSDAKGEVSDASLTRPSTSNETTVTEIRPYWPPKTKRELTIKILELCVYWGTRFGSAPVRDGRALQLMQSWMEQKLSLVEGMKETVLGAIMSFVRTIPMLGMEANRRQHGSTTAPKMHPLPNVPQNQLAIRFFAPEEIARQLCLWYQSEFSALSKEEVYALCSYAGSHTNSMGPNTWSPGSKPVTMSLQELSSQQQKWIKAEMATVEGTKKKRPATFETFIETAICCLELSNFLAVRQIYNVLSEPIYEDIVEVISKKAKDSWFGLKLLFTGSGYAWNQKIASALSEHQPIVLPIEWVESSISHNTTERDWWKGRTGLWNIDKLSMTAQTWKAIERTKQAYNFTLCPTLKDYIIAAATDAANDIPLSTGGSARDKSGAEDSTTDQTSESTEEEPEETSGDEEKEGKKEKDKEKDKSKKMSFPFKGMFARSKKEPSTAPQTPNGSATSLVASSSSPTLSIPSGASSGSSNTALVSPNSDTSKASREKEKDKDKEKEKDRDRDLSKRATIALEKTPMSRGSSKSSVPSADTTPRNSRGGSASSSDTSSSTVYANTPEFRAAVLRMISEDEDFRSSIVAALGSTTAVGVVSSRSASPSSRKRKGSSESSKIAKLEAKVFKLEAKLALQHANLTESDNSEGETTSQ